MSDFTFDALMAQRDAAYWAAVAAIAAWFGVITSAIGLGFLWQQLRSNAAALRASAVSADAASTAARIAFQQSRPWIKLSLTAWTGEVFFTPSHAGEMQYPQISLPIRYENVGQTPALGHFIITRGIRDPHLDGGAALRGVWREILEMDWNPQAAVFPGDAQDASYGTSLPWPTDLATAHFAVLVVSLYKTAIEEPWHATPLVIQIHGIQASGNPFRAPEGARTKVLFSSGGGHGIHPI